MLKFFFTTTPLISPTSKFLLCPTASSKIISFSFSKFVFPFKSKKLVLCHCQNKKRTVLQKRCIYLINWYQSSRLIFRGLRITNFVFKLTKWLIIKRKSWKLYDCTSMRSIYTHELNYLCHMSFKTIIFF